MSSKKNSKADDGSTPDSAANVPPGAAVRETIESIIMAVILAFLFRSFVAEAFVIPTGSMAPTLYGRHIDVACPECGYRYQAGASIENSDHYPSGMMVGGTTCPICRYQHPLDRDDPNQRSFNGDRILVSKFAYLLNAPQRWDVIVFKYPGNAKQNYIKRLVGLPDQKTRLSRGDVFFTPLTSDGPDRWQIARKPDHKLLAMLQIVDDTHYRPENLQGENSQLFRRWMPWSSDLGYGETAWRWDPQSRSYSYAAPTTGPGPREAYIRYHHKILSPDQWEVLTTSEANEAATFFRENPVQLRVITDYYAYNDYFPQYENDQQAGVSVRWEREGRNVGLHWVGDLALEADVQVQGDSGTLILDLVEAGDHFRCRFNVEKGTASLTINDGKKPFSDADGEYSSPVAKSSIQGAGAYRLRISNVDEEVRVWVNGRRLVFDSPTTYSYDDARRMSLQPVYSQQDPGDIAPAGIGSRGLAVRADRMRLYRDVYYVSGNSDYRRLSRADAEGFSFGDQSDVSLLNTRDDWHVGGELSEALRSVHDYQNWAKTDVFRRRNEYREFIATSTQFIPLGDNSPQSKDARFWGDNSTTIPDYVERELLIGKAMLIYWPHYWRPYFLPNFKRMGRIR